MTLTKAKIVDAIADQIGYPKKHSSELVEILLILFFLKFSLNIQNIKKIFIYQWFTGFLDSHFNQMGARFVQCLF